MGHKAIDRSNSLQETFFSVLAIILLMFLSIKNTYELSVRRVKTVVKSYVQLIQATFYISIFIIQEYEFHISQTCKGSSQILIWGKCLSSGRRISASGLQLGGAQFSAGTPTNLIAVSHKFYQPFKQMLQQYFEIKPHLLLSHNLQFNTHYHPTT